MEGFECTERTVIILRGAEPEAGRQLRAEMAARFGPNIPALILCLPEEVDLTVLDEAEMEAAGWSRKDKAAN